MALETFISTVAAVLLSNLLFFLLVFGVWRASKIEKRLGVKNGGDFLPLPLLLIMLVPCGLLAWGGLLIY